MKILSPQKTIVLEKVDRAAVLFGKHDKKKTGRRLEWRTGLHEEEIYHPLLEKSPFYGRGWQADFLCFDIKGSRDKIMREGLKLKDSGSIFGAPITSFPPNKSKDKILTARSKPELVIAADNLRAAESAIQLIPAAATIYQDHFFDLEQYETRFGWGLQLPELYLMSETPQNRLSRAYLVVAARIAARASHKKMHQHALFRYWSSKKLCAVSFIETHHKAAVQRTQNPYLHTIFSQAIVMAYGAIEELDLIIHQRHINKGHYTDAGKDDLLLRLGKIKIHETQKFYWIRRAPQQRIENEFKFAEETKVKGNIFKNKDCLISIVDAIHRVGRLRNKVSAHKFNEKTATLTTIDVLNAQNLARCLILSSLGLHEDIQFYVF